MGGPSSATQNTQAGLTAADTTLANTASAESAATYAETAPGLATAEQYYQGLASGNPSQIFSLIAPATSQIESQSQQAASQIKQNTPRGGAQNLALAQNNITEASQIGNLATSAYTSAFPALGQLSATGLGLSTNQLSTAVGGSAVASSSNQALGTMQNAQKADISSALGGLASAGGQIGAASVTQAGGLGSLLGVGGK